VRGHHFTLKQHGWEATMNNSTVLGNQDWRVALRRVVIACACALLAACGGGGGGGPPIPVPVAVPPTVALQPANLSVTEGQAASFSVAASGDAPLAYQWQRNGVDIAGATATSYTIAATVLADSGAAFRAVVSNAAGTATSNAATLTVIMSVPVLTVTLQPIATTVVAGTPASFGVAATCSAGTLGVQWQRGQTSGGVLSWANIAAGTALNYSFATTIGDSGLQFRAVLDCGGLSLTISSAALLTVTPPPTVTLAALPIVGLRPQAEILVVAGIDQETAGSYAFITSNRVKRLSADLGTITPVAGGFGGGSTDGAADVALFRQPLGLTHGAAGNVYVADTANYTIRRIAPDGTVSTLAGVAGVSGTADGTGSAARFSRVNGIVMGPDGDLYVTDYDNARIRRVTTAGVVSTYAGSVQGLADGAPLTARFVGPSAIAVAANGDVLVGDGPRIRRVVRSGNSAASVDTLAGSNAADASGADGIGAAAVVTPTAMVVRGNTLTFRDARGLVRQLDLTSTAVTTLAGSRVLGAGFVDGTSPNARVQIEGGLTLAPNGGFMLAESRALRQMSAAGALHTIASGFAQHMAPTGTGVLAQMPFASLASSGGLQAAAVDPAGNIAVFEGLTRLVRRISPAGAVTLAAGLTSGPAPPDVTDGVGSAAQFNSAFAAIASDSAGVLFVGDSFGVRRVALDNTTTLFAGSRTDQGAVDGNAGTARFGLIRGLAVKPGGDVFVADGNNAIRRVDAAGNVSTYAGVMGQSGSADGPIATARFTTPGPLAFAPDGSLYVVDQVAFDGVVRKISSDGASVVTLPIPANSAVTALAVDAGGTLYYGGYRGLMVLAPGGTPSVLIPNTGSIAFGANPSVADIDSIAVLGPKQLVVLSTGQILKVTLP
jgi:sugar lactone lactonase YvrE